MVPERSVAESAGCPSDPAQTRASWPARALLAILAVQFLGLGLWQAWHDAPTWDEGVYAAAGLTALTQHQLRINLEQPPLAKVAAAVPAWIAGVRFTVDDAWARGDDYTFTRNLLRAKLLAGTLRRTTFLFRLVPLLLGLVAAWLLYTLAKSLFDAAAGVVAASFWLTTPLVVGLGHVNGIDLPFTVATLTVALLLDRYLRAQRARTLALIGLAIGAALLVRFTGLLLAPLAAGAVVVGSHRMQGWWRAGGAAVLVCLTSWIVVWAGVRTIAPFPTGPEHDVGTARGRFLVDTVPWPREYVSGIVQLKQVSVVPAPAFVLGRAWTGARWWYWPASLAVKLPLPTLLLLTVGVVAAPFVAPAAARRRLILAVFSPAAALGLFALFQPRPIGVRYLLPSIALGLVAGAGAPALVRRPSVRAALVMALLAAQIGWLWESHPHSLAWTAPPFRPGYRNASDSSLDWGQDFYLLRTWSRGRRPWVSYAGAPGLGAAAIQGARELGATPPGGVRGWVAVSATNLTVYERDTFSWLRAYCPVATLGGTILLYHFARPLSPEPGPDAPPHTCPNGESDRI